MKYYFAYGSNMCEAQMNKRCPENRKIGIARLTGYKWIISARGYANILRSNKDEVEGVLYAISESDESSLDRYEGVSSGCYNKAMLRIIHEGVEKEALVYIDPTLDEGEPKDEYLNTINDALSDANLSLEYITKYIKKFIPERS